MNFFQLKRIAIFSASLFLYHSVVVAQALKKEFLVTSIYDIAFTDNELWQATDQTLIKRDLLTGAEIAAFDLPRGNDGFQAIAFDKQGNLWLPLGRGGVAFFDGKDQWKIWHSQNTPLFTNDLNFASIGIDKKTGYVWVGTYNGTNVTRSFFFDGNTWQEDITLRGPHIRDFVSGPNGEFVLCREDTLMRRRNDKWVPIIEPAESKYNYLRNPTFDPQGRLWLTAKYSEFYRYDNLDSIPKLMTKLQGEDLYNLAFDSMGNMYGPTYKKGLARWNGDKWEFFPTMKDAPEVLYTWIVKVDRYGRIWIAQQPGYYSAALTLWDQGMPQKNFFHGVLEALVLGHDGYGNVWFGGDASFLTRKKAQNDSLEYVETFSLGKDAFWPEHGALQSGKGEEMWLKGANYSLLHFDGTRWEKFKDPGLPQYLNEFCADNSGRLYVHGSSPPNFGGELKFLQLGTNTWEKIDFSIFGNFTPHIQGITTDEHDNFWFVGSDGLGRRNYDDGALEIYSLPSGANIGTNRTIKAGPKNLIYVFEEADLAPQVQLLQFDANATTWKTIPVPTMNWGLVSDIIWHVDNLGRIWLGVNTTIDVTTTSIWFWDNGIWTPIKGLPNGLKDITSDDKGNVYMGFYGLLAILKYFGSVTGTVYNDVDKNCNLNTANKTLPNVLVVATDGTDQYLGISQDNGTYRVYSGSSPINISATAPNEYWQACDPSPKTLNLDPEQPAMLDFLFQPLLECPHLTIDLSTTMLRRCFDNTYGVHVCNNGTAAAEKPYVDITFPPRIDLDKCR